MAGPRKKGRLDIDHSNPASFGITKLNSIIFGRYLWQRQNGKNNCLTFFNVLTIRHIRWRACSRSNS